MTRTTEDLPGFEQRLLSELRHVVDERQREGAGERSPVHPSASARERRRVLLPTAALGVLLAVAGIAVAGVAVVAPRSSEASTYATETLPSGRIHVVLAPDFDEAERLQAELANAGVEVRPVAITAAPALVGAIEILPLGEDGPSLSAPKPDGLLLGDGEFWIDPQRYDGSVELLVYVAPAPGEPWQQAPSIFHPDQPLGGLPCALDGALTTAALEETARGAGIERFTWLVEGGDPTEDVIGLDESAERPDGEVAAASLRAPGELEVIVRPAALVERFGHLGPPSMSLNLHDAAEPACTSELTARW